MLGLIGESTGIAAKVLKSMGINLKDARVEVEKVIGRGSGFVAVEIPFTPRAKRVLELSLEEARQLGALRCGSGRGRTGLGLAGCSVRAISTTTERDGPHTEGVSEDGDQAGRAAVMYSSFLPGAQRGGVRSFS